MIGNIYLKSVLVLFLFLFRRFVSVPEDDEGIGSKIEGESEAGEASWMDANDGKNCTFLW